MAESDESSESEDEKKGEAATDESSQRPKDRCTSLIVLPKARRTGKVVIDDFRVSFFVISFEKFIIFLFVFVTKPSVSLDRLFR